MEFAIQRIERVHQRGRSSEAEALLREALGFRPQAAPLLALQARLAKQD